MTVKEDPWYRRPEVQEALRQVFVALLLAALTVLGYDRTVAEPRLKALSAQVQAAQGAAGGAAPLGVDPRP